MIVEHAFGLEPRLDLPTQVDHPDQRQQQQQRGTGDNFNDHPLVIYPGLAAHSRGRTPAVGDRIELIRGNALQDLVNDRLQFYIAATHRKVHRGRPDVKHPVDHQLVAKQAFNVITRCGQRHHGGIGVALVEHVHRIQRGAGFYHRCFRVALA
ncbi:hypothetical protein D3C75_953210 [compost metagenome]